MRFIQKAFFGASALLAPVLMSAPAQAATIIGGGTSVTITAAPAFTGLGLTFAPFGSASAVTNAGIPTVTFLITGGTVNDQTGKAIINHNGSGLLFSGAGKALSIGDFVINTTTNLLTGRVITGGVTTNDVPLFNIGAGLTLTLTSQAAGAFTSVFGAPNLTGTLIGTADSNFVTAAAPAVPEAATWGMMLLGFGVVGSAHRLRRRKTLLQLS